MRISIVTLVLWLSPMWLLAQGKWEGGLFVGGSSYLGDLVESNIPQLDETNLALGLYTRYRIEDNWLLRLDLRYNELSGSDSNFSDNPERAARNFTFKSQVFESNLLVEWEPFNAFLQVKEDRKKPVFVPYIYTGSGVAVVEPDTDFSATERDDMVSRIEEDRNIKTPRIRPVVPVGGGVKINLKNWILGLDFSAKTTFSDYLDGVSETGNPTTNDWYFTGGLTITHQFGPKDTDKDGIADRDDGCPRVAGSPTANGCPDIDGDGVEDLEDVCPDIAGNPALFGCPDSDGDLVADIEDNCPNVVGSVETNGCPDSDKDSIQDHEDACPNAYGVPLYYGCPLRDTDGDTKPDYGNKFDIKRVELPTEIQKKLVLLQSLSRRKQLLLI